MEESLNPITKEMEVLYSAGCLPPDEQTTLQCEGERVPSAHFRVIKCCNFTDLCNKNLLPPYKPRVNLTPPSLSWDYSIFAPMIILSTVFIVVAIMCVMILFCKYVLKFY